MKERVKKTLILLCIGVVVNIGLAIIKMYVGLSSNSITIMLDATNSFFDIITCIVTIFAVALILVPRSEKAPFGYGRSEYLAGFVVAVVSVVVGGLFFMRSLNRMAMPEPIYFGWKNCVLITIAVPIKLGVGLVYYFANKKLKSKAISAIVLDSFLDTAMTTTSLVSFAISSKIDYAIDAIFGIVMSVIILVFAIKMVVDNVRGVLVGDGAKDERNAVKNVCERFGASITKLYIHDYGYNAKCGVVYVQGEDLDKNAIHNEIFSQCGADIEVVLTSNDIKGE